MAELSDLSAVDASNTARFPEGQQPSTVNNGARALEGMLAREFKDRTAQTATAGTSTAYTFTTSRTISALAHGVHVTVRIHTACGLNPTLNVDSLGAVAMRKHGLQSILAGELPQGLIATFAYDATNAVWQLITTPWLFENQEASITIATGANNNLSIVTGLVYCNPLSMPGGAFSLSGFVALPGGTRFTFYNQSTQNMTITNDATSTAANRILTLTGADVALTGTSAASFVYSTQSSRWILTGTQG